jgi:hypothetical protein
MKKVWEVLSWNDPKTGEYDIRCRSDIDTHSLRGFKRLPGSNAVVHILVGTTYARTFNVNRQFNTKKEAEHYAESLRLVEQMHGGTRSVMRQSFIQSIK